MRSLDCTALGQRIRVARKAKGLTQEQLSEIVDIQPNNLSHIERGLMPDRLPH